MAVYIPNYTKADMEELFKWARHGRNNAMIGVNTEIIEVPPHGRLIDADALELASGFNTSTEYGIGRSDQLQAIKHNAPTIIPAEEVKNEDLPI